VEGDVISWVKGGDSSCLQS